MMASFCILKDSEYTSKSLWSSLPWSFKSLTWLSSMCVALNIPSPEAIQTEYYLAYFTQMQKGRQKQNKTKTTPKVQQKSKYKYTNGMKNQHQSHYRLVEHICNTDFSLKTCMQTQEYQPGWSKCESHPMLVPHGGKHWEQEDERWWYTARACTALDMFHDCSPHSSIYF